MDTSSSPHKHRFPLVSGGERLKPSLIPIPTSYSVRVRKACQESGLSEASFQLVENLSAVPPAPELRVWVYFTEGSELVRFSGFAKGRKRQRHASAAQRKSACHPTKSRRQEQILGHPSHKLAHNAFICLCTRFSRLRRGTLEDLLQSLLLRSRPPRQSPNPDPKNTRDGEQERFGIASAR